MTRAGWVALLMVMLVTGYTWRLAQADTEPAPVPAEAFPHAQHQGLFLDCAACHQGDRTITTPEQCARCHDGTIQPAVSWTPEAPPTRPFTFDHALHLKNGDIPCADCHRPEGDTRRMAVVGLDTARCFTCHEIQDHFAPETPCASCHQPLAQNQAWTLEAVAAFPIPETHQNPDFLSQHGMTADTDLTRCATCHARETCEQCHLNALEIESIASLERDPRVAAIMAPQAGNWPRPANHDDPQWLRAHGDMARASSTACATCHARSSCEECHGAESPHETGAVLALMRQPGPTEPQGVLLPDAHPPLHDEAFATAHGTAAATADPDCAACHTESMCEDCHQGLPAPEFHGFNYVARHASEAFHQDLDCASCHSTEVFCRSCHLDAGLSQPAVNGNAYHDAHPNWLLAHAVAARQSMETCASCHQQRDCMRCHSRSGWGVNPHGEGFEADRLLQRNPAMCRQCHFSSDFDRP